MWRTRPLSATQLIFIFEFKSEFSQVQRLYRHYSFPLLAQMCEDRRCMSIWTLIICSCAMLAVLVVAGIFYGVQQTENDTTLDTFQSLHSVTSCTVLNTSIVAAPFDRGCTDITGSNTLVCNTATLWVAALNPWNNNHSEIFSGVNWLNINRLTIHDALVAYNQTFPDNSTFQCYLTRPTPTTFTDCTLWQQEQPTPPLHQIDVIVRMMILFGVFAAIYGLVAVTCGISIMYQRCNNVSSATAAV